MTDFLSPEDFEQELQNCLLHFYDYGYLQDSSVVKMIIPDVTTAKRIQHFRELVTEAIERMRPPENTPALAKGTRQYNVLSLRFIEQEDIDEITDLLAISRRQYYRELSRAVTSLANILRDTTPEPPVSTDDVFTLQSEIASLQQHTNRHIIVEFNHLLAGVIKANAVLASKKGIDMLLSPLADQEIKVNIDRALVRQLLLVLVSAIIGLYKEDGKLTLAYTISNDQIQVTFHVDDSQSAQVMLEGLLKQTTLLTLLDSIAGSLTIKGEHDNAIQLTIPRRRTTILIIDDNPDVIDLFRRLLDTSVYRLLMADDGIQILELIKRSSIDVIVLDIMLPRIDGFEILQTLKSDPATQHIPVVICSVLEATDLAISLGADAVLSKPPPKEQLIDLLNQWI